MEESNNCGSVETIDQTCGDALVSSLAQNGIEYLFFTSGAEIAFFQESIAKVRSDGRHKPPRIITVPLEHVALNAALGYAAVTGRPAATAVHVDTGTLHMGGAIHTAWRSGLPVLMMAGFPPTSATGSIVGARDEGGHLWLQQSFDQNGIVRNYTKWDHKLAYTDNPGLMISRAIQVATSQPAGPVYFTIPKELAFLPTSGMAFPTAEQLGVTHPIAPNQNAIDEIAERLVQAEHPVLIISTSGRNPEAIEPLTRLAEMLGCAVVDASMRTYHCLAFDHPLFQKQEQLKQADTVLILDAEIPWIPGRNSPPATAFVAHVDNDPVKLRIPTYEFEANIRINADSLLTIEALIDAVEQRIKPDLKSCFEQRARGLAEKTANDISDLEKNALARASDSPIDPIWLSYQIAQNLDKDCIVMDDTIGRSQLTDYLKMTSIASYFKNTGSSGGWGPGAAFGVKLAAPDKDVVLIAGDGFYQFGTPAPALWAAVHHGAPFLAIIYTNRAYSTGTTTIVNQFGEDSFSAQQGFEGGYFDPPIDFAMEAEAAGAYGETVRDASEVSAAIQRGIEQIRNGRPAVISVWLKRPVDDL